MKKDEKAVERAAEKAQDLMNREKGRAWSQAVLQVMQEVLLGRVDDLMIKAAGPLAGGSHVRSLCGALQGGVLTLGMLYGAEGENLNRPEALMDSIQPVKRLYHEFEKAFGSRLCTEIIRADLAIPEERKQWVDRDGRQECASLCNRTVRILFQIIGEKEEKR
jgi:C_GCAxxG_C_C family probable redox protein